MSSSLRSRISEPVLVPATKYGWLCEWDRWIYGRHYTFRVGGNWVIVTKWDSSNMWVENERWFKVNNAYYKFMRKFKIRFDLRSQREQFSASLQDMLAEICL